MSRQQRGPRDYFEHGHVCLAPLRAVLVEQPPEGTIYRWECATCHFRSDPIFISREDAAVMADEEEGD